MFMSRFIPLVLLTMPIFGVSHVSAQDEAIRPDLESNASNQNIIDGSMDWVEDVRGKGAVSIRARDGDTLIPIDGLEFTDGVIEVDLLGQSAPPQSNFLGIAFRIADRRTFDLVYLRPFNFRADDPVRRSHAIQYVSEPRFGWSVLRQESPGTYESALDPAPDGDDWVHLRLEIEKPTVRVYVDGASEPSLVVEELSDRAGGGLGLWVGPGEGGHFANLQIEPASR